MKTTPEQLENLTILADYLENNVKDSQFNISIFRGEPVEGCENPIDSYDFIEDFTPCDVVDGSECGSVGCAVGWGVHALMEKGKPLPWTVSWATFAANVFGREVYEWAFSDVWSEVDGSREGAIKRIRYFVDYGLPEWFMGPYDVDLDLYEETVR